MTTLVQLADQVEDIATKNALMEIVKTLDKIQAVRPVSTDVVQLAHAVNQITGKL